MLAKLAFLSAVALLPLAPKGSIRGDRAYEPRLPPLLPVENLSPPDGTPPIGSPRSGAPLASVIDDRALAHMPGIPAKVYSIDVLAMARIPDMPAIEFFIEEWLELGVEHASSLDDLLRDYKAMRAEHSFLPPISKKRLSQLLTTNGCRRFISDSKDSDGQRHRVVYFEMRAARRSRRAA